MFYYRGMRTAARVECSYSESFFSSIFSAIRHVQSRYPVESSSTFQKRRAEQKVSDLQVERLESEIEKDRIICVKSQKSLEKIFKIKPYLRVYACLIWEALKLVNDSEPLYGNCGEMTLALFHELSLMNQGVCYLAHLDIPRHYELGHLKLVSSIPGADHTFLYLSDPSAGLLRNTESLSLAGKTGWVIDPWIREEAFTFFKVEKMADSPAFQKEGNSLVDYAECEAFPEQINSTEYFKFWRLYLTAAKVTSLPGHVFSPEAFLQAALQFDRELQEKPDSTALKMRGAQ